MKKMCESSRGNNDCYQAVKIQAWTFFLTLSKGPLFHAPSLISGSSQSPEYPLFLSQ